MKVSCDIIRDLLPLYAEDMVSDDTKAMVEEHLADCPGCAQQLDRTRQARMVPVRAVDTDTASIERVGQAIRKRRWTAAAFAVLLALTVSLGLYLVLNKHQYIPLEQAVVEITVTEDRVEVKFTEQVLNFVAQREIWAEESEESLALICYTTRWGALMNSTRGREAYVFSFPKAQYSRLYYESTASGEENQVIWGKPFSGGTATLPRLAMHYYFLIAVFFGTVLLIPGLALRKKTAGRGLMKTGAYFFCYAVSSFTAAWGDWRVYGDVNFTAHFLANVLLGTLLWLTLLAGSKLRQISRVDKIA